VETENANGGIGVVWMVCAVACSLIVAAFQNDYIKKNAIARPRLDPLVAWHFAHAVHKQRS
jgi:hypothetical protein